MHSISVDPQNMQQEQKYAHFEIHDWAAMPTKCVAAQKMYKEDDGVINEVRQ